MAGQWANRHWGEQILIHNPGNSKCPGWGDDCICWTDQDIIDCSLHNHADDVARPISDNFLENLANKPLEAPADIVLNTELMEDDR